MTSLTDTDEKRAKLLLKAAYWLRDYADCFRKEEAPGARQFRAKLLKIASQCRAAGRSTATGGGRS
jgi:hypothetical protein